MTFQPSSELGVPPFSELESPIYDSVTKALEMTHPKIRSHSLASTCHSEPSRCDEYPLRLTPFRWWNIVSSMDITMSYHCGLTQFYYLCSINPLVIIFSLGFMLYIYISIKLVSMFLSTNFKLMGAIFFSKRKHLQTRSESPTMAVSTNGGTPKWMVYKGKSH